MNVSTLHPIIYNRKLTEKMFLSSVEHFLCTASLPRHVAQTLPSLLYITTKVFTLHLIFRHDFCLEDTLP